MCALRVSGLVCGAAVTGIGALAECDTCLVGFSMLNNESRAADAVRRCCAVASASCFALAAVPSPITAVACAGVWIAAAAAAGREIREVHSRRPQKFYGDSWQKTTKNAVILSTLCGVLGAIPGTLMTALARARI